MKESLKIAIAGGGTSGHVQPTVAVIDELKKTTADLEFVWFGERNGREDKAAAELGIKFIPIKVGKVRRYLSWKNVSDPFNVAVGYSKALIELKKFNPDVIFSKAGYVAVPVLLAGSTLGIPIVAHESDIVMGLANRLASKFAKVICTGFPVKFYLLKNKSKMIFTGNPVLLSDEKEAPEESRKFFGFANDRPVFSIFGGSQGAMMLNELIWELLPQLLSVVNVIHQTGPNYFEKAQNLKSRLPESLKKSYVCSGYFDRLELDHALSISFCVFGRAGANAIADYSYFGLPAILTPLPTSASDHQNANAKYVEERGAAIVIPQEKLNADILLDTVKSLIFDKPKREKMAGAMSEINPKDASFQIAQIILEQGYRRQK